MNVWVEPFDGPHPHTTGLCWLKGWQGDTLQSAGLAGAKVWKHRSLPGPGEARSCSTNSFVINQLSQWVSDPFPPIALWRRHSQTVRDKSFSYKIYYKCWILPISGVASGRVCACRLRSKLVLGPRISGSASTQHIYLSINVCPPSHSIFFKASHSDERIS